MTRILIPRGSTGGSSSNPTRASLARTELQVSTSHQSPLKDEEIGEETQEQQVHADELSECSGSNESTPVKNDDIFIENFHGVQESSIYEMKRDGEKDGKEDNVGLGEIARDCEKTVTEDTSQIAGERSLYPPPPPPVPPPKHSAGNQNVRRHVRDPTRRVGPWPVVSTRTSPTGSHPSSPRSLVDNEGYNSADEQNPCFGFYNDMERERQFEIEIRRAKGLEVKRMMEDGNCLFRAVADQVYGDSEGYDLVRQLCIDYMEKERDHFSPFITEGFTSYCKRKRRDKVYGNNAEIQAMSEIYNRPIHIYSYSTEPINTFHGNYHTDTPPIRLSFHHGNHYNSLVDPRRLAIGAGLGFSSLRGSKVDKDQVMAAIKAQQDQQIDNALLAEGRFYSDLEITEKEIERMVMEASRAEYIADNVLKQQMGSIESSTSGAEPSSSAARSSKSEETKVIGDRERAVQESALSNNSMQVVLSMGFSYLQVMEAYSIFGDDVDSMVCYLLETANSSSRRWKGKATE